MGSYVAAGGDFDRDTDYITTRITADGQIRTCLFSRTETDLRTPLRHGASDLELAELWARAQGLKAPAHGIGEPGFVQPTRTMSAIGG